MKNVDPSAKIDPRLRVIPMGWSHALDLAQTIFSGGVADALSMKPRDLVVDGRKPPSISEGIPLVYVDNFVFCSSSSSKVEKAVAAVRSRCHQLGLPTHEEIDSSRNMTVLGWDIDGI